MGSSEIDTLRHQVAALEEERRRMRGVIDAERRRFSSERALLLAEIRHRVGNSLQIVTSLLEMAKAELSEGLERRSLDRVSRQIRSHAMAYQALHGSSWFDRIRMRRPIADLLNHPIHLAPGGPVRLQVDSTDFWLSIGQAAPFLLALSDTVQHAAEHPPTETSLTLRVRVRLETAQQVRAVIAYNPQPAANGGSSWNLNAAELLIARNLVVSQLDGGFIHETSPTERLVLRFPRKLESPLHDSAQEWDIVPRRVSR